MPRRGIPGTYPAPPLEWIASGLMGLSPSMPVPCSMLIFSSMVISLTTMDARWSGDKLELDQGWVFSPDWAEEKRVQLRTMLVRLKNRFTREQACRGIIFPRAKIALPNR